MTNLDEYLNAFADESAPFLTYYTFNRDRSVNSETFTRGEFLSLARRAAGTITSLGCRAGDRILHCLGRNHYGDLAFRLGAAITGTVPVTVNWQADDLERILYKINRTRPSMIVFDQVVSPSLREALCTRHPDIPIAALEDLSQTPELPARNVSCNADPNQARIIIFTSGTTGNPKGVQLSFRSYKTNRATFETLLQITPDDRFAAVVVNPLHHTNSTAITDWAMRRPGSEIHLIERYSTPYWKILAQVDQKGYDRIIAPTVSRHFDFLAELNDRDELPIPLQTLTQAMHHVDFLIGSAPVGPTTIRRLQTFAGRIPTVRFGSTETCLQVLGIPHHMDDSQRLTAFEKGWNHRVHGEPCCGYYIGRPTPPYTEARIVRSITPGEDGFLEDQPVGEPGYLVTRGDNVMTGYVGDPEATAAVMPEGWYTGLRDVAFQLRNEQDGTHDYYWVSRDSALLIRGGANYAYDQISRELSSILADHYQLDPASFDLAVVGLRIHSEHEDSCCVTIELKNATAQNKHDQIRDSFLNVARRVASKGARPDMLRFAEIPRNFKGAILVPELKQDVAREHQG